jgi:hypothetical protein
MLLAAGGFPGIRPVVREPEIRSLDRKVGGKQEKGVFSLRKPADPSPCGMPGEDSLFEKVLHSLRQCAHFFAVVVLVIGEENGVRNSF